MVSTPTHVSVEKEQQVDIANPISTIALVLPVREEIYAWTNSTDIRAYALQDLPASIVTIEYNRAIVRHVLMAENVRTGKIDINVNAHPDTEGKPVK